MLAAVRIRGTNGSRPAAVKTVELLRLNRINHMVLLEDNPVNRGMLQVVKDYVTWGEIDLETLKKVIELRALAPGRKPLNEEILKEKGFSSTDDLAKVIFDGKSKLKDLGLVPVLRLNPPRGGYEAIRKSFTEGGTAGYRGAKINDLILKMLKPGVNLSGKNKD